MSTVFRKFLLTLVVAFSLIQRLSAGSKSGFPIVVRPQSVQIYSDMPEKLAKDHPGDDLLLITFTPVDHSAQRDGANLKSGEGSWLDRGMRSGEPGFIRLLLPHGDMLAHTLKTSEGPFLLQVTNSGNGYMETVPLESPKIEMVSGEPSPNEPGMSHEQADSEINAAYAQLVDKYKGSPALVNGLKQVELNWIHFKDERAKLAALIKGKSGMDEATLTRLTDLRAKQLQHLAPTGLLEDPISYRTQPDFRGEITALYDLDRQILVDQKNGPLLAGWIATQKAWNEWCSSEMSFDPEVPAPGSEARDKQGVSSLVFMALYADRIDDLKELAAELKIGQQTAGGDVFKSELDADTVLSPDKSYRIELSFDEKSANQKAVVRSFSDNSQAALIDPITMEKGRGEIDKRDVFVSDVSISPDSRWIFQVCDRAAHRDYLGDAYLYKVVGTGPIKVVPALNGNSFATAAMNFYGFQKQLISNIELENWKDGDLTFDLTISFYDSKNPAASNEPNQNWSCTYNLKTSRFGKITRIPLNSGADQ